ncbi:hypothetical protein BCR32DRAFT_328164, partial [Anaeromyces robustus]
MNYSERTGRYLDLNLQTRKGNNPLLIALLYKNFEMGKLIFNYAEKHNIMIKIDKKNNYGDTPLSLAMKLKGDDDKY